MTTPRGRTRVCLPPGNRRGGSKQKDFSGSFLTRSGGRDTMYVHCREAGRFGGPATGVRLNGGRFRSRTFSNKNEPARPEKGGSDFRPAKVGRLLCQEVARRTLTSGAHGFCGDGGCGLFPCMGVDRGWYHGRDSRWCAKDEAKPNARLAGSWFAREGGRGGGESCDVPVGASGCCWSQRWSVGGWRDPGRDGVASWWLAVRVMVVLA